MKKLLSFAMVLLLTAATFAQSNTGRLIGTVSGPDGVLPGNSSLTSSPASGPTDGASPAASTSSGALMPSPVSPGSPASPTLTPSAPLITSPNVQQQSQLIQQQVQQQLRAATEAALQQTRPVQDEK